MSDETVRNENCLLCCIWEIKIFAT